MACSCGKKSCSGGCSKSSSGDLASIKNLVSELTDKVDAIERDTKFLKCGHPIIALENLDDIGAFNEDTGLGSECWEGWAICNGGVYYSENAKKNITTPNLLDKFIVGAGDAYEVGDTGGLNTVTLSISEMPSHDHTLTDPGHLHAINDSGHIHGTVVGSHTHTITVAPHTHTTDTDGAHKHALNPAVSEGNYNGGTGPFGPAFDALVTGTNYAGLETNTDGDHDHIISSTTATASASSESIAVYVSSANTGIEIEAQTTGITMASEGGGEAHENRPPYVAVLFVMKL